MRDRQAANKKMGERWRAKEIKWERKTERERERKRVVRRK